MDTIVYSPLFPENDSLFGIHNDSLPGGPNDSTGIILRGHGTEPRQQIPVLTLVIIAVYILFGLLIGLLNSLTIVAIARSPELKNVTNMFVLSLTCADLLLAPTLIIINFLPTIARLVGVLWARVIYSLFLSVMFTSSGTSLFSILAIAVDRYFAVLHPYSYKQIMTPFRARIAIVTIWVYCTVLMFSLVGYYISFANPRLFINVALLSVILPVPVYLGAVVSQIVICLIASVVLYIRIFFGLRAIRQKSASLRNKCANPAAGANTEPSTHTRESRRTTTTMALVLGALILSWLPYALVSILTTVNVLRQHNWYIYVSIFSILLLYANSFMNPIIYAARSAAYRQAYWKVLCCCTCTCTTGSDVSSGGSVGSRKTEVINQKESLVPEKNGNVVPVDV